MTVEIGRFVRRAAPPAAAPARCGAPLRSDIRLQYVVWEILCARCRVLRATPVSPEASSTSSNFRTNKSKLALGSHSHISRTARSRLGLSEDTEHHHGKKPKDLSYLSRSVDERGRWLGLGGTLGNGRIRSRYSLLASRGPDSGRCRKRRYVHVKKMRHRSDSAL